MNSARRWWMAVGGSVVIAAVVGAGVVMAQSPTPNAGSSTAVPGTQQSGTFKSNEDATHEKGEAPDREAAEDSGKGFHGGGTHKPNEDATHEAGEPKDREAQEDAGQAPAASPSPTN